jgi:hypothetical protein
VGVGEGKVRSSHHGGYPSFSPSPWTRRGALHNRRCPVPVDDGEAATHHDAIPSTVEQKEMREEKTFLPLVGKQNHGGTTAPPSPLHIPPNHHVA